MKGGKSKRRKAHREAISKYRGDPKYHLEGVEEGSFSITSEEQWAYRDNPPDGSVKDNVDATRRISNRLPIDLNPYPHMILYDKEGNPRFALHHFKEDGVHYLGGVQRLRSPGSYVHEGEKYRWDADREKESTLQFKAELGVHPSEFLLAEFISRHAYEIKKRLEDNQQEPPLVLRELSKTKKPEIYGPLIDRFFKKDAQGRIVLDSNKERVKALLGL